MDIRHVARGRTARLALTGELDMANAEVLARQVDETLASIQPMALVIDAAGLEFCDSVGVSALMRARAAAQDQGSTFQLVNVGGLPGRVLGMVGMLEVLTAEPSPCWRC